MIPPNNSLRGRLFLVSFVALLILQSAHLSSGETLTISTGHDIFHTTGAGKEFGLMAIPGHVFGKGYEDFSGLISFTGRSIASFEGIPLPTPTPAQPENQVDTIMWRAQDAILPKVGSEATIPIEMVALQLESTSPIEIVNPEGEPELWVVLADAPENPEGTMTIRRDFENGGTYDAVIPVNGTLTFIRTTDKKTIEWDRRVDGFPIVSFDLSVVPWLTEPVTDGPTGNFEVTQIEGFTSNFVAAYTADSGRENICGINLSISGLSEASSYHGHCATSTTPKVFFPFEGLCQVDDVPAVGNTGLVILLLLTCVLGAVLFRRSALKTAE